MVINASSRGTVFLSVVGAVALLISAAAVTKWAAVPSKPRIRQPEPVTATQLRTLMIHAGLQPDTFSASGVGAEQASAVIGKLRSDYSALSQPLEAAVTSVHTTKLQVDQLSRKVQSGRASAEEITSLRTAQTQADAAAQALTAARDAVLTDLTQVIGGESVQAISTIRSNNGHPGIPVYFLVASRPENKWVRLRNAIASRDVSLRLGETPSEEALAFIATAESNASVAAAKLSFQNNGAAVSAAVESAINPH